jgi:hypothetical protein
MPGGRGAVRRERFERGEWTHGASDFNGSVWTRPGRAHSRTERFTRRPFPQKGQRPLTVEAQA